MAIRNRLRILILERNLARAKGAEDHRPITLRKISADTGLALSTLAGLSSNRVRRVDYETLNTLCAYFGVQPGELLEYIPEDKPAG